MAQDVTANPLALAFIAAALLGWSGVSMVALAPSRATPEAPLTRPGRRRPSCGGGQALATVVEPVG